jgi:hypothetical protein
MKPEVVVIFTKREEAISATSDELMADDQPYLPISDSLPVSDTCVTCMSLLKMLTEDSECTCAVQCACALYCGNECKKEDESPRFTLLAPFHGAALLLLMLAGTSPASPSIVVGCATLQLDSSSLALRWAILPIAEFSSARLPYLPQHLWMFNCSSTSMVLEYLRQELKMQQ